MANETDWRNSPIAWFAALERARHIEDFELAAEAQRQLKRLGIIIIYRKQAQNKLSHKLLNYCGFIYSGFRQILQAANNKNVQSS
jgi:hypothetical protein